VGGCARGCITRWWGGHGRGVKLRMLPKAPAAPAGTFDAVKDGLVVITAICAIYVILGTAMEGYR
jgi:hypothetical protein